MFTVKEYSDNNQLSPVATQNAERTVKFINDVLTSHPNTFRISSTVRTPAHNARVGGVANSKHLTTRALAVDFMPIDGRFTAQKRAFLLAVCNRHQFELVVHNVKTGLHYHCEYEPGKPRR